MAIKLRLKSGSHRPVVLVYAYDPEARVALVKTKCDYDQSIGLELVGENELEAIQDDADGTLHDVPLQLRARAEQLVNDN